MKVSEMVDSELVRAAHNMEAYGGSFATYIARAFFVADLGNRELLLDTFGHLFERYAPDQGWNNK
jgi:hypothetical protein